tara:strand:+ start:132 stop:338 length:207 start_codon:yes stop_codon:yes gene_type:complete
MRKGTLDRILEKAVSRKLFTFLTATGLMLWSDLDSETWGMIAVVYIASQSVVDVMKTYRYGDSSNGEL